MGTCLDATLIYSMDDFEFDSVDPKEIFSYFSEHAETEFSDVMMRSLIVNGVSEDIGFINLNKSSNYFWCSQDTMFSKLLSENNHCSSWKKEQGDTAIFCGSRKIGVRQRFSYSGYRLQELYCWEKQYNKVFYELSSAHDSMGNLPPDLIKNIWIKLPIDALLKFSSISKSWSTLISRHLGCLESLDQQHSHFLCLTKRVGTNPHFSTVHMGSYSQQSQSIHLDRPIWSPNISCSYFDGQLIGSANGMVAIANQSGPEGGILQPVIVFNPVSQFVSTLPTLKSLGFGNFKDTMCVSGFSYCASPSNCYYCLRIIYPGRHGINGDRGRLFLYTLRAGKSSGNEFRKSDDCEWHDEGFVPSKFGKFCSTGININSVLYFMDGDGLIASYSFDTWAFSQIIEPGIYIGERGHRQASMLAKLDNDLAVTIMDYCEQKLMILHLHSSCWKPVITLNMSLYYDVMPLAILSDQFLFVANDRKIMSRLFADKEDHLLVQFSDSFKAEFVNHTITYSFLAMSSTGGAVSKKRRK